MTTDKFPNAIRVSGLPFYLQGWNNIYVREKKDVPSYRLEPYTLYGFIDIIGVRIYQSEKGEWWFRRDCDSSPMYSTVSSADLPLGKWPDSNGLTVHTDVTIRAPVLSVGFDLRLVLMLCVGLLLGLYLRK